MTTTPTSPKDRGLLRTIFVSPDEPRLRAGWRLLLQVLLLGILTVVFTIPVMAVDPANQMLAGSLSMVAAGAGVVVSVWLARRLFDKRSYTSLGLAFQGDWLRDTLVGIAIAAVIMAFVFALLLVLGWLQFRGFVWQHLAAGQLILGLVVSLLLYIMVGYYEEVLLRGYVLQNLADGLNLFWAVAISSAVFGLLHLTNPHASLIAALGITFAGLFMAYGYLRTGNLWLPIGLHIGWNFFEGVVFGFPVSGTSSLRLIEHSVTGPEWFTGGAFGPEAGVVSILAMGIGTGLIWLYTRESSEDTVQD